MKNNVYLRKWFILIVVLLGFPKCVFGEEQRPCDNTLIKEKESVMSLAGEWGIALDSADVGVSEQWYERSFGDKIRLPGTTDEAGYGFPNVLLPSVDKPQIQYLTRKCAYVGPAWYMREVVIPPHWKDKVVELKLERVIWHTSVWVDGCPVSEKGESLIAPHRFDLTDFLTPGKHTLVIRVDNRKMYDTNVRNCSHAYTSQTQGIWNGILGEISLRAKGNVYLENVQVYPDISKKQVRITGCVNYRGKQQKNGKVRIHIQEKGMEPIVNHRSVVKLSYGKNYMDVLCSIDDSVKVWDEFNPVLYDLDLSVEALGGKDTKIIRFGMRELEQKGNSLWLNGHKLFLRGTLECCVFPLTGRPPMDTEGWRKVFLTAREWGLNHLRFHSWCPPEAAFRVADSLGFYLQVELPLWAMKKVGQDKAHAAYLYEEANCILSEYGNHPSFCFMSLGNELPGDFSYLNGLLNHIKGQDNRRLYATTSFSFAAGHGTWPEADDDFLVTQKTKYGWIRGQGVLDSETPSFDKDYAASVKDMPVPLIIHEMGQYAVYPNLKEIEKYTGTLVPLNFMGIKNELVKKGLLNKADDYLKASGRLAFLLYKEEVERALKTTGISGYQMLDLHDFPGQGSALVGLLDAFWDNKGIAKAEEFRQFCAPIVPLANFSKAVYTASEEFEARINVSNYSNKAISNQTISWRLETSAGISLAAGELEAERLDIGGENSVGVVKCPLSALKQAEKLLFTVSLKGMPYKNSWKIWVYPETVSIKAGSVVVTADWEEARHALEAGRDVLLNPAYETCKGIEGKFVPVFWSPIHFPRQAGTMGLLLNPEHPAFAHFPTSYHTDWQWWHLVKQSRTLMIDSLSQKVTPLLEYVDNFVKNRRLSTLFEVNCGKGRLVFCSMDLLRDIEKFPEKKQLLYSLLEYMQSADFQPEKKICFDELYNQIYLKDK